MFTTFTLRNRYVLAAPVLALMLCATGAQAQHRTSSEKAAAESLFDHAMQYLKAGNLAAACDNFEKSQKIDPAVGTLLYLAECYERTGRTASAWATFREAASLARELRESDRAAVGDQRAAALEPQLSRFTIQITNVQDIAGLTVRQDDAPLNSALFGAAIPVDPGKHTLIAEAPGYEPWKHEFEIAAGARTATVDIPALVAKPSAPPPEAQQAAESAPAPPPPAAPSERQPAEAAQTDVDHTVSLILMGGGLAFIGAGIGFGLHAKNLDALTANDCEGALCATRDAESISDDAQQAALLSNIGYGIGASALILGGVLFFLDTSEETTEQIGAFHVVPAASGAHVWYQGTF